MTSLIRKYVYDIIISKQKFFLTAEILYDYIYTHITHNLIFLANEL